MTMNIDVDIQMVNVSILFIRLSFLKGQMHLLLLSYLPDCDFFSKYFFLI